MPTEKFRSACDYPIQRWFQRAHETQTDGAALQYTRVYIERPASEWHRRARYRGQTRSAHSGIESAVCAEGAFNPAREQMKIIGKQRE
jgi:hypothetical protein